MSGSLSTCDGDTRYMSADTAPRCKERYRQTATSITIENSEILRGLKRLSDENRIDQELSRCKELECGDKIFEFDQLIMSCLKGIEEKNEILRGFKRLSDENIDQVLSQCKELENEDKLYDYLQQELNVTFNMRDENVRYKELCDVLFYYLLTDEEPVREIQILLWMIHTWYILRNGWYEMCTSRIGRDDIIFTQFYKRLGNKPQHLEYMLYKHPQLLFNEYSTELMERLNKYLPHDNLHQILLKTRDENAQTSLFYTKDHPRYIMLDEDLYRNKFNDLCELLSVRNKSGRTALHVNSDIAYRILFTRITLNNHDKVIKLLSIRDNNNKTVYDTTDGLCKERLTWFTRQYEHNNYPLYDSPRVLILYNTNDRPGAEKEAEAIQQALESVISSHYIELKKMVTKREVLQLIAQQAANWHTSVLIVCLMSHGNIGTIDDSEKNPITLTSIEGAMCSDQLKERPKILITQSCQTRAGGRRRTHEEATSSNTDRPPASAFVPSMPYEPVADHFLSVQSCLSGQESTRNVFIPYLAEEMINSSKTDNFVDLVPSVSYRILRERSEQIPIVKSTLRGTVCLKDRWWGN